MTRRIRLVSTWCTPVGWRGSQFVDSVFYLSSDSGSGEGDHEWKRQEQKPFSILALLHDQLDHSWHRGRPRWSPRRLLRRWSCSPSCVVIMTLFPSKGDFPCIRPPTNSTSTPKRIKFTISYTRQYRYLKSTRTVELRIHSEICCSSYHRSLQDYSKGGLRVLSTEKLPINSKMGEWRVDILF